MTQSQPDRTVEQIKARLLSQLELDEDDIVSFVENGWTLRLFGLDDSKAFEGGMTQKEYCIDLTQGFDDICVEEEMTGKDKFDVTIRYVGN